MKPRTTCPLCRFEFVTVEHFDSHAGRETVYTCPGCGARWNQAGEFAPLPDVRPDPDPWPDDLPVAPA
ncbi:hypothetical protein JCM15519_07020 [Fundidesulfovibrio butyratiphilus]